MKSTAFRDLPGSSGEKTGGQYLPRPLRKPRLRQRLRSRLLQVFLFTGIFLMLQMSASATDGKVIDDRGQPLSGVTVQIKGRTEAKVTDANGKYSITGTNAMTVLVFSYVGYVTQEVEVGNRSSINITLLLESDKVLNDVVVVGYGRQKKVNLVGAVSSVNVDEKITSRALPNISSGLSGMVPGLGVTQSSGMAGNNQAALLIRGLGTVNNSSPLIVVDGMPDVDINRVNINDIETISVLKDATSASVYGSRAANGVILITTKSGRGQEKTSFVFNSSSAVELATNAYGFMADYPRSLTLEQRRAATSTLAANQLYKNGTIDQWMALGMIDPLRYPNTDWWDVIMRNGSFQNYNLSASGGSDKANFFFSVGLKDEKGLQINNDYKQYNARFNFDYKLRENMNVGAKFNGNWSKYTYALSDGFTDPSPSNTAGFDMQYAIAGITPFDPKSGLYGGVMAYGEDPQAYNPYTLYVNTLNFQNRQEANPSMYVDWTPVKGLTARADFALTYYNQFFENAPVPNTAYNFQTNAFGSRVYVGANAGIANTTTTGYKTMLTGRLNYHTVIKKNHDLSALFVYSEEYWYDRSQSSGRTDRL
ncbi:MAG: SusC/RagA family TonB-linked outer membrane protein, partial [Chitinophagaceae bacterium]